jgi:DNA-binding IclR family transcriptional regulator
MKTTHQIPVLGKAIQVLEAVASERCEPTAAVLARTLSIAPATCYRILQTLAHAGWIQLRADGRCELGLGLLPLLQRLQRHELLGRRVKDALRELTAATGVASKVSAREDAMAVTLLREASPQPMSLAVQPGARFHLTLGATGAVLLSALADAEIKTILRDTPPECWQWQKPAAVWKRVREVRRHGVVTDAGTYRPDVFGLSVPLLDLEGHIQGALTLTGLIHGHTKAQLASWRRLVLQKAAVLNQGRKQKTS